MPAPNTSAEAVGYQLRVVGDVKDYAHVNLMWRTLLCGFEQFGPIWTATAFYPIARVVFGADVLDAQIARLDAVLADNGYSTGLVSVKQRHQAIAFVLLLNRRPRLDHLSWAALDRA